jgi:hypothetical protein
MQAKPAIKKLSAPKLGRPSDSASRRSRGGLVAALAKLAINRPSGYDWKNDYARALEEKYACVR